LKSDLKRYHPSAMLHFATSLPAFFREQVTAEYAQHQIKRALGGRERNLLELVRRRIYECPPSPYLKLLKIAGCEFADFRTHVLRHGVEGTLERLAREGVYLTSDEFKGKKEVVRGGQSMRVFPGDFERVGSSQGFVAQSSGTRNHPVRSFIPLDWLAARTLETCVFFSAHDLFARSHALYDGVLPAAAGVNNLLIYTRLGRPPERWFAHTIPVDTWLEAQYHYLMTSLIVVAGKHFVPGFPRPEFMDSPDLPRIVRWVEEKTRAGRACCITTVASNAARIALTAWEMGVSLRGTKFVASGEPLTDSKRELIERVEGSATLRFTCGGSVNVGFGCAAPLHSDDVHVNQHTLALLPNPRPLSAEGPSIHPLLCTTLHPSAPRMLLNVESGDYAVLETRDCGCALGKIGLTLHAHHIRSFEKFTSEGMNYVYTDLFALLEQRLPAQFGGGPGDYQLVEEEDTNGQTRLTLRVRPRVGDLDEAGLLSRLEEALSAGSRGNRSMAKIWHRAGTLRVRRVAPHASPRGKILPLHLPY
jgi:hypothetical protein